MNATRKILILLLSCIALCSCRKESATSHQVEPQDILADDNYNQLVVEIAYVDGYEPEQSSVNAVLDWLDGLVYKPEGIDVVYTPISSPNVGTYSIEEIRQVEADHENENTSGSKLTLFIFFADDDYEGNSGNSKVIGVAYGSTSICIFEETVREFAGGLGQPSIEKLETTIIEHELAHLMGLVNNGTPMVNDHQDQEHGHHCTNENCLMYWSVETSDFVGNLLNSPVPTLDMNCRNDLSANGGK